MPTIGEVTAALDRLYDPSWAEPWDAVGLVCGDPDAGVRRVLFAVDPVAAVVDEAIEWQADLVVTHHPLFLKPVHGVAANSPKGRVIHSLLRNDIGLFVAHTNADSADPGVSDALGETLGLQDLRPLSPRPADPVDKIVTFVPHEDADRVLDALSAAGAGVIGDYSRCAWTVAGTGTFLPGVGASPTIGDVGRVEEVAETRLEMVLPREARTTVISALRAAHPYEEPAFDVYELAAGPGPRGIGRIGVLPNSITLEQFADRVVTLLPDTVSGVRVAGDPDAFVRTVAVCGGAGDSLLDVVRRSDVDVFVTADLRHHPASEASEHRDVALVDVAHWASEWPWLPVAAERLRAALKETGATVETRVSDVCTDPWTMHVALDESNGDYEERSAR